MDGPQGKGKKHPQSEDNVWKKSTRGISKISAKMLFRADERLRFAA